MPAFAIVVSVLVLHPTSAQTDLDSALSSYAAGNWSTDPPQHFEPNTSRPANLVVDSVCGLAWSSDADMFNFDAIRISAIGFTRINYFGTQKPAQREGVSSEWFSIARR